MSNHLDCMGKPLKVGDVVVAPSNNELIFCVIKKLTPKMLRVKQAIGRSRREWNIYPKRTYLLPENEATIILLRNSI